MPQPPRKRTIILATRNPGKLKEIQQVLGELGMRIVSLNEVGEIREPAEDGRTFAENARKKGLYYARATNQWSLADDSGLAIDALDGAPGVRSARYAADQCPQNADRDTIDRTNNTRVLEELRNVPDEKHTARFICHLTLASPEKILIETQGTIEGIITHSPCGSNGFGYDPLFFVPELGCTMAELDPEEKNRISHRGKAVRRFKHLLTDLLESDQS